jgi:carbamate kinase
MSQGQIGYLLVQTLENHLRRLRRVTPVACLVTETIVDAADPGLANPTKPVGPFYEEARARTLMLESGYAMKRLSCRHAPLCLQCASDPNRDPDAVPCDTSGTA